MDAPRCSFSRPFVEGVEPDPHACRRRSDVAVDDTPYCWHHGQRIIDAARRCDPKRTPDVMPIEEWLARQAEPEREPERAEPTEYPPLPWEG